MESNFGVTGHAQQSRSALFYGIFAIQLVLAYEWLMAGWEKLSDSAFVGGMGKTLGYFASQNPHVWYKNFVLNFASSHTSFFAYAVSYGEFLVGVGLLVSALLLVASRTYRLQKFAAIVAVICLLVGAKMSAHFYFAAGWTGPGTAGLNTVMFWAQLILAYAAVAVARTR